jgi:hypothetical protein
MLPPVVSALIAFVIALLRSSASLRLEHLALRHQLPSTNRRCTARGCGRAGMTS